MYLPQIHHIQNVFDLFKGTDSSSASQFVSNDHLKQMDDDVLFHIGIRVGDLDIKKVFGDVKVKAFFFLKRNYFFFKWTFIMSQIPYNGLCFSMFYFN